VAEQQDVFGLQIGVDEAEVVEKGNATEQLASESLNVGAGKGNEAAGFEKVENGEAE